jgi:DNA-binding transcriptional LysR family regulator
MGAYPQLDVVVETGKDRVDLFRDETDVAIRRGREGCDELVARHLKNEPLMLCAAPAYLAPHAPLESLTDLASHFFLTADAEGRKREIHLAAVEKTHRVRVESVCQSDDLELILQLALSGRGIALVPVSLASRRSRRPAGAGAAGASIQAAGDQPGLPAGAAQLAQDQDLRRLHAGRVQGVLRGTKRRLQIYSPSP